MTDAEAWSTTSACGDRRLVIYGTEAKGPTWVAVAELERTAMIREMYRTVFGEGDSIGELDAATRLRSLFVGVSDGGVPRNMSLAEFGERE